MSFLAVDNIQKGELCGDSEHLLSTFYPGFQQLSIIRNSRQYKVLRVTFCCSYSAQNQQGFLSEIIPN